MTDPIWDSDPRVRPVTPTDVRTNERTENRRHLTGGTSPSVTRTHTYCDDDSTPKRPPTPDELRAMRAAIAGRAPKAKDAKPERTPTEELAIARKRAEEEAKS